MKSEAHILEIGSFKKTRDRPTDRRTDRPSYRDAWTHLKITSQTLITAGVSSDSSSIQEYVRIEGKNKFSLL